MTSMKFPSAVNESEGNDSLRKALVLGLRDYVHKTGFPRQLDWWRD